jgi:hypothetical protein
LRICDNGMSSKKDCLPNSVNKGISYCFSCSALSYCVASLQWIAVLG